MSAPVQLAAQSLMRHNEYLIEGNPRGITDQDAHNWLRIDAERVAECATIDEVVDALADTGWFDPTSESDHRARRVAADLGLL